MNQHKDVNFTNKTRHNHFVQLNSLHYSLSAVPSTQQFDFFLGAEIHRKSGYFRFVSLEKGK